jgi:secretion/DNA translocation related TadE-like protein
MRRHRGDEGMATVFSLGIVMVLTAVTAVVASVGVVVVARHRAESAADLAALVVTGRAHEGEAVACAAGRATAEVQGGRLVSCRLEADLDAVVRVVVRPPGRLGGLGQASAVARAGRR